MHRPIGVTILAILAALAGVFEVWRALVFVGVVSFNFVGKEVRFTDAQWGAAFWAVILALIWFWVAAGFWNLRGYAWSFGNFIAIFTVVFGFFALLGGQGTMESETVGWFLALIIFFYLNYPGVQKQFVDHEMSLLTPEQRVAMQQMQSAQEAMMRASAAPAPAAPPPPPAPPVDPGTPSS